MVSIPQGDAYSATVRGCAKLLFLQSISERGLTGSGAGMVDRSGSGGSGADTGMDMDMDMDTYPDRWSQSTI